MLSVFSNECYKFGQLLRSRWPVRVCSCRHFKFTILLPFKGAGDFVLVIYSGNFSFRSVLRHVGCVVWIVRFASVLSNYFCVLCSFLTAAVDFITLTQREPDPVIAKRVKWEAIQSLSNSTEAFSRARTLAIVSMLDSILLPYIW